MKIENMKTLLFLFASLPCITWARYRWGNENLICDEKGQCKVKEFSCSGKTPLKSTHPYLCFSCDWHSFESGHFITVEKEKDCLVCLNREIVQYKDDLICKLKDFPGEEYIETISGYKTCGYCAKEDEIVDCSRCLKEDYEIVDGKCKRIRPCYRA